MISAYPSAIGVAALVAILGLFPPLARPGYELALCLGLFGPSAAAIACGLEQRKSPGPLLPDAVRALKRGGAMALAALAVVCLHGLRAGFCDARAGLIVMLLGPMIGMMMASLWGAIAAEIARFLRLEKKRWAVLFALAGPLAAIAVEVAFFALTPMVYAYDPFVGYFTGSLYDTVIHLDALYAYRLGSLATLVAVFAACANFERRGDRRLAFKPNKWAAGIALGAAFASVGLIGLGDDFGAWQTAGTIARALGARTAAGLCTVIHEPAARNEAQLLAKDCDAHIRQISDWLGIEPAPVTAFLFRDAEQKRFFTGAAGTSIAKPWRHEVYLQSDVYPHPVLRHELVHALSCAIGRGPFCVAGSLGGWLPDPGLIEGLAEAAAPRDDELSADEWSAAMLRLKLLPSVGSLFSLGFFGGASSVSYTAAGSFVSFVRDRYGPSAIRAWYGGGDLARLTGSTWPELERGWRDKLQAIPLSEAALSEARIRFDRPGVLARRCPHAVDRLLDQAASAEASDPERASALYRRALALDPGNQRALFGIPSCHDRGGDSGRARTDLARLSDDHDLPAAARASALEKRGDLELRAGAGGEARADYRSAAAYTVDEDRLRTLDIKAHYAEEPVARGAIVALLIGTTSDGPNQVEALDRVGVWRNQARDDGTPDYLIGRQYFNARDYELAQARLADALGKTIVLPRVRAEALRLSIRAACAAGAPERAQRALAEYRQLPSVRQARKTAMAGLVARCSRY